MHAAVTVTPAELPQLLLDVAMVRPPFLRGQPGIGKSSLVEQFADAIGMPCVSLLGTQLAPEDIMGVPQILDGKSRFCPPELIARDEPYVLFLDELNAAPSEVQKSFYSLLLDHRVGAYTMPPGSVVLAAGNRAVDNAITRPMSTALVNRVLHIHLEASASDWLTWAGVNNIHPWVLTYLTQRPDHLFSTPPKTEEAFSTPRSWHMLSDVMTSAGLNGETLAAKSKTLAVVAHGTLTPAHAAAFIAYTRTLAHGYSFDAVLKGKLSWPAQPQDRDLLYFLAEAFRARLVKELPRDKSGASTAGRELAHRGKALLLELATISLEVAQLVIANDDDGHPVLPAWFLVEVTRDLPRLVTAR